MYQYKMVQVPPNIQVKYQTGNEVAAYLETVVNAHAAEGWEFYRVDPIGVSVKPGCIASLFGMKDTYRVYYVISFRGPL